jgi:hypothetical protein
MRISIVTGAPMSSGMAVLALLNHIATIILFGTRLAAHTATPPAQTIGRRSPFTLQWLLAFRTMVLVLQFFYPERRSARKSASGEATTIFVRLEPAPPMNSPYQ